MTLTPLHEVADLAVDCFRELETHFSPPPLVPHLGMFSPVVVVLGKGIQVMPPLVPGSGVGAGSGVGVGVGVGVLSKLSKQAPHLPLFF